MLFELFVKAITLTDRIVLSIHHNWIIQRDMNYVPNIEYIIRLIKLI